MAKNATLSLTEKEFWILHLMMQERKVEVEMDGYEGFAWDAQEYKAFNRALEKVDKAAEEVRNG